MKQLVIFFGIIITVTIVCFKYSIMQYENTATLTQYDMVSKNGNYFYQPVRKNTFNYIKNYNSGRLYRAKEKQPKVVFYINVVDTTCPYRRGFQNTMQKFANSPKWNKNYKFVNIDMHMVEELYFVNSQDKREYESFNADCDYFCIVDLNKKLIFKGAYNSDKYVNNVLYAFYNN